MKLFPSFPLILVASVAQVCGRSKSLCTANAAKDDIAALSGEFDTLSQRFAAMEADNEALRKQLADARLSAAAPAEPENLGTLATLAKGAGVELKDVAWRKHAGLDPEQAVAAAVAQKEYDTAKAKRPQTAAQKEVAAQQ